MHFLPNTSQKKLRQKEENVIGLFNTHSDVNNIYPLQKAAPKEEETRQQ